MLKIKFSKVVEIKRRNFFRIYLRNLNQSLMLLQLIERDLTYPPSTRADLEARKAMHRVTGVYFDPAIELDLAKTPLPTLR